ncbi:MAG: flagellar hook assembly protein FlgD [Treponema sp.]|nr:flagellar hook assembly protein FlgD [Treponema sp.]
MKGLEFNPTMSAQEKLAVTNQVNAHNSANNAKTGRVASQHLGKDDFLKLLLAQLANQDPTSPMENTEFIAQMAQFSSLEQMTNMSTGFTKMASMLRSSEAVSAIGKNVEIDLGDTSVSGVVEAATRGENPQVQINGMFYNMEQIKRIYN